MSVPVCTACLLFHSPVHDEAIDEDRVPERGLLTVPNEVWAVAVRRAEVIGPLAEAGTAGEEAVEAAAERLSISRRQVYVLLRRWREGQGTVSDLIPGRSSGGRGGGGCRLRSRWSSARSCACTT